MGGVYSCLRRHRRAAWYEGIHGRQEGCLETALRRSFERGAVNTAACLHRLPLQLPNLQPLLRCCDLFTTSSTLPFPLPSKLAALPPQRKAVPGLGDS